MSTSGPIQPALPPAPAAAAPPQGALNRTLLLVFLLVVLLGGGAATWFFYLNPGRCAGPLFDWHTLPTTIPLPSGCAFQHHQVSEAQTDPLTRGKFRDEQWMWTVTGSDPATVSRFAAEALAANGWTDVHTLNNTQTYLASACQGKAYVVITLTLQLAYQTAAQEVVVSAPAGGSVELIDELTALDATEQAALPHLYCSRPS